MSARSKSFAALDSASRKFTAASPVRPQMAVTLSDANVQGQGPPSRPGSRRASTLRTHRHKSQQGMGPVAANRTHDGRNGSGAGPRCGWAVAVFVAQLSLIRRTPRQKKTAKKKMLCIGRESRILLEPARIELRRVDDLPNPGLAELSREMATANFTTKPPMHFPDVERETRSGGD